ncbi:hypothetical protein F4778DRAFT_133887 [Xylariomycetidae sp. FL2044]|nr:hypothetical protein F4778DRAFT_133887 [Xylariomycetidae sp. FL2044]
MDRRISHFIHYDPVICVQSGRPPKLSLNLSNPKTHKLQTTSHVLMELADPVLHQVSQPSRNRNRNRNCSLFVDLSSYPRISQSIHQSITPCSKQGPSPGCGYLPRYVLLCVTLSGSRLSALIAFLLRISDMRQGRIIAVSCVLCPVSCVLCPVSCILYPNGQVCLDCLPLISNPALPALLCGELTCLSVEQPPTLSIIR